MDTRSPRRREFVEDGEEAGARAPHERIRQRHRVAAARKPQHLKSTHPAECDAATVPPAVRIPSSRKMPLAPPTMLSIDGSVLGVK
jgi:hypothetical protein